jgi:hypothetical protein
MTGSKSSIKSLRRQMKICTKLLKLSNAKEWANIIKIRNCSAYELLSLRTILERIATRWRLKMSVYRSNSDFSTHLYSKVQPAISLQSAVFS